METANIKTALDGASIENNQEPSLHPFMEMAG
jgi:hypothetical protein